MLRLRRRSPDVKGVYGTDTVVDDDKDFLFAGRELLRAQRRAFHVDTAQDAEEALGAIRLRPDGRMY